MKQAIFFLLFAISTTLFSQNEYTELELRRMTDSILSEANLLFKFERVAWLATDLSKEVKKVNKNFGSYFVYQIGDTIRAIVLSKKTEKVIYELNFINNFRSPHSKSLINRDLTTEEKKLIEVKQSIIRQVIDLGEEIYSPDGYGLNLVFFEYELGYKLYIITGTSQSHIIPFGNDWIFIADKEGKISNWRKFHSRLIPTRVIGPDGETVISITHSHLMGEPFITATDICTFKLYAPYYDIKTFSVYSPALKRTFTYHFDSDEVEISDKK